MITGKDKQQAWAILGDRIARGLVPWPDYLSQEQIDYLTTSIQKSAIPGEVGKKVRNWSRWFQLDTAFAIFKAKHPDKSDMQLYKDLAKYYSCGWSTVRKAHQFFKKRKISQAYAANRPGAPKVDLADLELPHINFDNFPTK